MSDRTERHPAAADGGAAREGRESGPVRHSMSDRTERHPAAADGGAAREGRRNGPVRHTMSAGVLRSGSIRAAKIVVAGGFGAGKTTFIGSVSDVVPLRTEALTSEAAAGADDLPPAAAKETTTVAMDFGRITIDDLLVLYLFGTPGQRRYWFMWDEVTTGGIGAVILADVRRLADAFPAVDYFDARHVPYVIAVNTFPDAARIDDAELREALGVPDTVPVLACDARDRAQVRDTLIRLVQHVAACYRALHPPKSEGEP